MVRKWLLASAAVGCLLASGGALADNTRRLSNMDVGTVAPFYGSITPFYGSINPFYGSITPFYGSINPFYGQINPFWGNITPFWGDINPFYGSITPFYGNIDPFWGNISPFYGNINPFYGTVQPFWQAAGPQWGGINSNWDNLQSTQAANYSGLQTQLNSFVSSAASFWGSAYSKATGTDFMTGFANPMLAKYGIDPSNPASLATVGAPTRSAFFLDWYDHLMNYTGTDHVDWWMGAVHWTPQLAQIQGWANNSAVGILDAYTTSDNADVNSLKFVGGYKNNALDHGAAVASLIAAKQDGLGVMGVAPNATIQLLYNPFDSSGTADWSDVANGISTLYGRGAHVINASLGIPGYVLSPEWANILSSPQLASSNQQMVLVKAAGNEGTTQTTDIAWNGNAAPSNLIMVGSVGPTNNISTFSNTPGEACILVNGVCNEQNKLKYRFLVAPGELVLVQDNHGDVTRVTGTSFAAPLVTGAISLLQDRWPWLQQHSAETVQIILQSATDLGAPGVDPVYGWGELNIQASQSPLNFNNLTIYKPTPYVTNSDGSGQGNGNGGTAQFSTANAAGWTPASLKASILQPGQLALWSQQNAYIVAFENIGTTYRDFTIPLSSALIGKNVSVNGNSNPFQSYLYQRLIDWAGSSSYASSFVSQTTPLRDGDWSVGMVATASSQTEMNSGAGPFHAEFVTSNAALGVELRLGEGNGSHAFQDASAFSMRSDFDPATGGVNPVLGFASGGTFVRGALALTDRGKLSFGFSRKSDGHTVIDPVFGPLQSSSLAPNKASASVLAFDYKVLGNLSFNASYTQLHENNGLLGAQGSGVLSLPGGQTDAVTLGTNATFASGWQFSGSATMARTSAPNDPLRALNLARSLQSAAFEVVATKTGLLSDVDMFRVSLASPLHVESGALQYRSLEVVDRSTGEVGPVAQTWNASGQREYRMEALYRVPLMDGRAAVSGFGLLDLNPPTTNGLAVTVGTQFTLGF